MGLRPSCSFRARPVRPEPASYAVRAAPVPFAFIICFPRSFAFPSCFSAARTPPPAGGALQPRLHCCDGPARMDIDRAVHFLAKPGQDRHQAVDREAAQVAVRMREKSAAATAVRSKSEYFLLVAVFDTVGSVGCRQDRVSARPRSEGSCALVLIGPKNHCYGHGPVDSKPGRDRTLRPQTLEPRRDGRADPSAVGAGTEPDGSGDGARNQARRTVDDTGRGYSSAARKGCVPGYCRSPERRICHSDGLSRYCCLCLLAGLGTRLAAHPKTAPAKR
jgi:hypothetical protein